MIESKPLLTSPPATTAIFASKKTLKLPEIQQNVSKQQQSNQNRNLPGLLSLNDTAAIQQQTTFQSNPNGSEAPKNASSKFNNLAQFLSSRQQLKQQKQQKTNLTCHIAHMKNLDEKQQKTLITQNHHNNNPKTAPYKNNNTQVVSIDACKKPRCLDPLPVKHEIISFTESDENKDSSLRNRLLPTFKTKQLSNTRFLNFAHFTSKNPKLINTNNNICNLNSNSSDLNKNHQDNNNNGHFNKRTAHQEIMHEPVVDVNLNDDDEEGVKLDKDASNVSPFQRNVSYLNTNINRVGNLKAIDSKTMADMIKITGSTKNGNYLIYLLKKYI